MNVLLEKPLRRKGTEENKKLTKAYRQLEELIDALNQKELPEEDVKAINLQVKQINTFDGTEKKLIKLLRKTYTDMVTAIKKSTGLVPKNHFQMLWMVYGMLAGVVLSSLSFSFSPLSNGAFAAMLIPFGMLGGMLIGVYLDKQAKEAGKQIDTIQPEK